MEGPVLPPADMCAPKPSLSSMIRPPLPSSSTKPLPELQEAAANSTDRMIDGMRSLQIRLHGPDLAAGAHAPPDCPADPLAPRALRPDALLGRHGLCDALPLRYRTPKPGNRRQLCVSSSATSVSVASAFSRSPLTVLYNSTFARVRSVVVGIMGAYGIMKAIEWGLASDLLPYTWIGFDEPNLEDQSRRASTKEERVALQQRHRARLEQLREEQAAREGPIQILRSTMHLMVSMRGAGYQFSAIATKPYADKPRPYLRRLLLDIAVTHPLLTVCAMTLLEPPSNRDATLAGFLPASLSPYQISEIGGAITGLAMGTAVFAALTLGYSCATLMTMVGTWVTRSVPLLPGALRMPEFDPREYPPLFKIDRIPDSVAEWWAQTWHAFFSRASRSGAQP